MSARRLSRAQIEALLPHRGDALFLTDAEVDGPRARGEAAWELGHPHIRGHFPGLPVVPGVYLIEAAAQLAGLALALREEAGGRLGVLAGVRRALFHRPVRPGRPFHLEVALLAPALGPLVRAAAVGRDEQGRKAATLELTIGAVERAALAEG